MKQISFLALILLFSCSAPKNKFEDCIINYLNERAMGVQLKYEFQEILLVDEITSENLIKDMYLSFELNDSVSIDSVKFILKNIVSYNKENEDENDKIWKFRSERFNEVSKLEKGKLAYSIVHATHKFENPLINNAVVEVKKTYVINNECKVLGVIDDKDMKEYEDTYKKTPFSKYEYAIYNY